jgi:hypothetical protein
MLYNTDIKKVLMLFSLESLVLKLEIHNPDFIKKHNTYMMLVFMLMMNYQNFIKEEYELLG